MEGMRGPAAEGAGTDDRRGPHDSPA
jgi:hypothetical protein